MKRHSRRIKFRIWDTFKKCWCSHTQIIQTGSLDGLADNGYIPLQYTGINDKNETEIYEGDIVISDEDAGTFEIKWDVESASFFVGDDMWPNAKLTVVGNIFENPKLL